MAFPETPVRRAARAGILSCAALAVAACGTDSRMAAPVASGGSPDLLRSSAASVSISPTSASATVGQSVQFTATVRDSRGRIVSGATVSWRSSDTTIAKVSSSGLASALAAGKDTIIVSAGSASARAVLVVSAPVAQAPGTVSDLAVTATTDSVATLRFTQVGNGAGGAASYEMRYAAAPMSWGSASPVAKGSCASPIAGTSVGSPLSCTVNGLAPGKAYNFQVVAFRGTLNVNAVFGGLSNIAAGSTSTTSVVTPPPPPPPTSHVDTIFHDGFESGNLSAWQDNYRASAKAVLTDPSFAKEGQRYLAITYAPGSDGGSLTHFFMPGYDSAYVRVWVRFPTNWSGGTKLIMFRGSRTDNEWSSFGVGGACPDGTNFFTANVVTRAQSTLPLRFYTYYVGMARESDGVTCYGRYGDSSDPGGAPNPAAIYFPPLDVSTGGWHLLEFQLNLNTPGMANGSERMWLDGVEKGEWSGLVFRTSNILMVNAFTIESSMNETQGGSPQAQTLYFDDVLVLSHRP